MRFATNFSELDSETPLSQMQQEGSNHSLKMRFCDTDFFAQIYKDEKFVALAETFYNMVEIEDNRSN